MRRSTAAVYSAIALMEDRLGEPLTLGDLCTHTRVSPRALQQAFKSELGCTPMSWLRDRRLDEAERQLAAANDQETTVTRVVSAIGITHLGRFSGQYRRRFGVIPSETLAANPNKE